LNSLPDHREKLLTTAGYYASFVGLGAAASVIGPTLTGLAGQTHSPLSALGVLFTARSLGYIIGSWASGRLYDRLPGHPVAAAALLGIAGLLALVPALPSLWLLTLVMLLLGLMDSALDVGANTLIVRVHGAKVGPFMNALHFFFGAGAFIAPVVVGWAISRTNSIQWAYWGLALLMLPPALWLLRRRSPEAKMDEPEATAGHANVWLVVLIALLFFFYVGTEVGFGGWVSSYALATKMFNAAEAAYLASVFYGAFTVGRLAAIPIASRVRPRYVLLVDLLGTLASVGLIVALPQSRAALWAGTLGAGLFMASVFPTNINLASRRLTLTGRLTGLFFSVGSLGSMTLPLVIGPLLVGVGPRAAMSAFCVFVIASLVVWAALMARTAQPARPAADQPA
jgi:FHS family Na+ dependent glucose MFS transporter 1